MRLDTSKYVQKNVQHRVQQKIIASANTLFLRTDLLAEHFTRSNLPIRKITYDSTSYIGVGVRQESLEVMRPFF
jgi:hypothetical protein